MAENKNPEYLKKVEDDALEKIAGGVTTDEKIEEQRQKAQEALETVSQAGENLFKSIEQVNEAIKTNICPICNQPIVSNGKKCRLVDVLNHKHGKAA